MGTDDAPKNDVVTRFANAHRICTKFDPDGNGSSAVEVAKYPYAVVIAGRCKTNRVVWATDAEDIARIYAACTVGDENHERERVARIYSVETGKRLDALAASSHITVVAEVGGVRFVLPNDGPVSRLLDNVGSVSFAPRQFAELVSWTETSDEMAAIDVRAVQFYIENGDPTVRPGIVAAQGDEALYLDVEGNRWEYGDVIEVTPERLPDHEAMNKIHAILNGEMWCGADDMPVIAEIVEKTGRTVDLPTEA